MTRHREPQKTKVDIRERALLHGADTLSDSELLALVLGTGATTLSVLQMATALLETFGGLPGLAAQSPHQTVGQRGVGPAKAVRMTAAIELGRRAMVHPRADSRATINGLEAVVTWARPRLAHLDHEEMWLLCLDSQYRLKSAERIAQGGRSGCSLDPKDILRPAIKHAASAIIVVHNHPSGHPEASREDLEMTRQLGEAAAIVGLHLLDHVIVARDGARSILMPALPDPEDDAPDADAFSRLASSPTNLGAKR